MRKSRRNLGFRGEGKGYWVDMDAVAETMWVHNSHSLVPGPWTLGHLECRCGRYSIGRIRFRPPLFCHLFLPHAKEKLLDNYQGDRLISIGPYGRWCFITPGIDWRTAVML